MSWAQNRLGSLNLATLIMVYLILIFLHLICDHLKLRVTSLQVLSILDWICSIKVISGLASAHEFIIIVKVFLCEDSIFRAVLIPISLTT